MPEKCKRCRDDSSFDIAFTMAFQPIVDVVEGRIWGYEALVRGLAGEGAGTILSQVTAQNRYTFDQACRVKAIELAGAMMPQGSKAKLSINFMPNAVYEPKACIRASLGAAARVKFDPKRLMFEFTENEKIADTAHVQNIIEAYKQMGFTTALDDFGAGYAGLGLLAEFQPDVIKLDMELIRGIATSLARQVIIRHLVEMAKELGVIVLAEGVETQAELLSLRAAGIALVQGYLFAKPELEMFRTEDELPFLGELRC
ncbi:EAL domain-containing protein [Oryzicola mucosus]|uniref:EAL domain-containing protein n=1 Tax=Oryzicola mucosus TaxID=2767425 RepID=A0A8J6PZ21_9HYPH|nr:EAL domain-containing protein [Oryzicola mucosus]MBD0417323.1 EAL domain-containing protein [Oryzicola mucosus]